MNLRDYQIDGLDKIRSAYIANHKRVLYTLPTGGGKTVLFTFLAKRLASQNKRVCILVHREELIAQVSDTLARQVCPHGIIKAGYTPNPHPRVQVASVFSLARRLDHFSHFDMLIIDECHHAPAGQWDKVVNHYNCAVLGVTATPVRLDGKGLKGSFDVLVKGPTTKQLIERGHLVRPRLVVPQVTFDTSGLRSGKNDFQRKELEAMMDKPTIYGDIINTWRQFADGLPTVAFCVSVAHAEHTAAEFASAGIQATSIDGKLTSGERQARIDQLRSGEIKLLTSCDLISEGFDLPGIHCAVMLRPTKSLSLYLQQVGRALRPAPGKSEAIIIDHVNNISTHMPPTWEHDWELTEKRFKPKTAALRTCFSCYAIFPATEKRCPVCGDANMSAADRPERKAPEKKESGMVEVSAEELEALSRWRNMRYNDAMSQIKTMDDLRTFAKAKGYKNGFVWMKSLELGLRQPTSRG